MKKLLMHLLPITFIIMCSLLLTSCFGGGGIGNSAEQDYNNDISEIQPESITTEDFVCEEGKTYYTSSDYSLMVSVNGEFLELKYFTVDGTKRIFDNVYFYEDDYFYVITSDYKYIYAALADSSDIQYAEEERQLGEEVQINVTKSGIYTVSFDAKTKKFDLEYKAEITEPKYYTIKTCSVYNIDKGWSEMTKNQDNTDEFCIKNYPISAGSSISFYNNLHTSNYNVTLHSSIDGKLASAKKALVSVNVGGIYNVYINSKTYEVRLELTNPETATYSCVYYDGKNFLPLAPTDGNTPYIFTCLVTIEYKYDYIPDFHTDNYNTYSLEVEASELVIRGEDDAFFKETGDFVLTIDLKEFKITVARLPE